MPMQCSYTCLSRYRLDPPFALWSVVRMSEVNIALGKTAYMSSSYASNFVASHGNDGNYSLQEPGLVGSRLRQERTQVKRVRVSNTDGAFKSTYI